MNLPAESGHLPFDRPAGPQGLLLASAADEWMFLLPNGMLRGLGKIVRRAMLHCDLVSMKNWNTVENSTSFGEYARMNQADKMTLSEKFLWNFFTVVLFLCVGYSIRCFFFCCSFKADIAVLCSNR